MEACSSNDRFVESGPKRHHIVPFVSTHIEDLLLTVTTDEKRGNDRIKQPTRLVDRRWSAANRRDSPHSHRLDLRQRDAPNTYQRAIYQQVNPTEGQNERPRSFRPSYSQ
ncbi:MAG: hypothetical protein ACI91O_000502 [Candidatus Poriferisodalaceae bacterium]